MASYWLHHKGDSLPYNTGRVAVCKRNNTYSSLEVLQILKTGPVTTATNERSFVALRYLKTYLGLTEKEA